LKLQSPVALLRDNTSEDIIAMVGRKLMPHVIYIDLGCVWRWHSRSSRLATNIQWKMAWAGPTQAGRDSAAKKDPFKHRTSKSRRIGGVKEKFCTSYTWTQN